MTKQERNELSAKGITILRPQYDHRKDMWKIVKYNHFSKGWVRYGTGWYVVKPLAIEIIQRIVNDYPKQYAYDM